MVVTLRSAAVEEITIDFDVRNGHVEPSYKTPVADDSDIADIADIADVVDIADIVDDDGFDTLSDAGGADGPLPEGARPEAPVPPAVIAGLTAQAVRLGQDAGRTGSTLLDRAILTGDVFVYVDALPGTESVSFRLSGPESYSRSFRTERVAPFDLAGGSKRRANAFDTRELMNGTYRLDVRTSYRNGPVDSVSVSFDVHHPEPGPMAATPSEAEPIETGEPMVDTDERDSTAPLANALLFSTRSSRAGSEPLAGATVEGRIYAHLTGSDDAGSVTFFLDDVPLNGKPIQVERFAPWDARGGSKRNARPLDTRRLSDGRHTLSAQIMEQGRPVVMHAGFTVAN